MEERARRTTMKLLFGLLHIAFCKCFTASLEKAIFVLILFCTSTRLQLTTAASATNHVDCNLNKNVISTCEIE